MRTRIVRLGIAALLGTSGIIAASPVDAEGDVPPPGLKLIASGLDNPRGVTVDRLGRVYVAEAGRGGDALVDTPLGDSDGPVCVGDTGAIARIAHGKVRRVVSGLPSVSDAIDGVCAGPGFGAFATGPQGVDVRGRRQLAYSVGLGGAPDVRDLLAAAVSEADLLGTLKHRRWRDPADLAEFESAADPDMEGPDSNPYGVLRLRNRTVVADAGGNSLVEVRRNGSIEVLAVFAPRCVPFALGPNPIPPEFNPCGDQALFPAQAVPTDVAIDRHGNYIVTTLGGFPFAPGESLVYRIDRHHAGTAVCSTFAPVPADGCEVFADGLTALVGVDVGPDGSVYVVQMADNGLLAAFGGDDAGSVQVLDPHTGDVTRSIEGLNSPGGVAVAGGLVYITNHSVSPGGGEVVAAVTH